MWTHILKVLYQIYVFRFHLRKKNQWCSNIYGPKQAYKASSYSHPHKERCGSRMVEIWYQFDLRVIAIWKWKWKSFYVCHSLSLAINITFSLRKKLGASCSLHLLMFSIMGSEKLNLNNEKEKEKFIMAQVTR